MTRPCSARSTSMLRPRCWAELDRSTPGDDPRLARMYREIFFPGSTFKVVTAAAGLDSNVGR